MKKKTFKILSAAALMTGLLNFYATAEEAIVTPPAFGEQGDYVARLEAALKNAKTELGAVKAQAAEQSRRIAELEGQLKNAGTAPAVASAAPVADTVQLQQELKTSKTRINELEEQLFVATDGKGVTGKEVAEVLPEGTYEWTENMRRMPVGVLFPKTATIPKGDVYARFSHVSQNQTFTAGGDGGGNKGNTFDDLLGLESRVKVGLLFGYGVTKNWDVMVQRSTGRTYFGLDGEDHSYDLWDVMTKVKVLDENKNFVDMAVSGGITYFWQNDNGGEVAGNSALLLEKSFWRFRAGTGFLYTSLSDWQQTDSRQGGAQLEDKWYPQEDTFGSPRPARHTAAIPLSLSFALTKSQQLFGEMAFPVSGYDTGNGPSMAAGWRYNTHTHAYSIYLSNTSNGSFNSAFTGGYKENQLDVFGFDISIFF